MLKCTLQKVAKGHNKWLPKNIKRCMPKLNWFWQTVPHASPSLEYYCKSLDRVLYQQMIRAAVYFSRNVCKAKQKAQLLLW